LTDNEEEKMMCNAEAGNGNNNNTTSSHGNANVSIQNVMINNDGVLNHQLGREAVTSNSEANG